MYEKGDILLPTLSFVLKDDEGKHHEYGPEPMTPLLLIRYRPRVATGICLFHFLDHRGRHVSGDVARICLQSLQNFLVHGKMFT
jgi:hypothetical protein